MKDSILTFPRANTLCPMCGDRSARVSYEIESFPYGMGEDQILLTANVPVIRCGACGGEVTDGAAEEIRHSAVCHHLGRLSPKEARSIREQYDLSQQEWANKTKLGIASIKRWESGSVIQNEAMDCYLRLLAIPSNLARVSSGNTSSLLQKDFRFQTSLPPATFEAALSFQLRKTG
jgi:putative zinc finger/helix-turn-helix YgiT family protein